MKACPKCGSTAWVRHWSTDVKQCGLCGYKKDWLLDKGQESVFKKNVRGEG